MTEFELRLQETLTHDSIWTRGFHAGCITAMIAARTPFRLAVLDSQLPALCGLLAKARASVRVSCRPRNRFHVAFCDLDVTWR